MRKFTLITLFFSIFLTFTVFAQKSYVNPTAKYAEMLGYRYEIATTVKGGEVGMVHLPDGRIVNAWNFYKGKVAQEYSYAAKLGFDIETETVKVDGYTMERAVCVRSNRGVEERIPLLDLMKMNGDELIAEVERTVPTVQEIATVDPDFTTVRSLPTEFDWRNYNGHTYIGDARDQGGCGSCYAFGAAAAAEGTYNYATGSYDSNTADFSEGYIAFCLSEISPYSSHFNGCNGADYDYYELQALVDIGIIDESYFPYSDANNQTCPSTTDNAPKIQFESWHRVASSDVDAIKTAIMTYGVVDAAVYVTTDFSNYSGGVWSDSNNSCSNGAYTTTNHAIALVGWGYDSSEGDYWILRNSWGTSWGEDGYMRIAVNSAAVDCAVCYMVYDNVPQPPVAGFSADDASVLFGSTVNFSDESTNSPTSWSWSFEGGIPSTSTAQNPSVVYNTPGTYNVILTATNAEGSDVETKADYITVLSEMIPEYCPSEGSDFSYEWISGVVVGDFNNTSGAAGYTDFTNMTATLNVGQAYDISLTPEFSGSTYNEYWKIWIDLNYDGDFDDAGENVFDQGGMSSSVVNGAITIPVGTAPVTTRMRVTMKYNAEPTACEASFSYGEVEDYTVRILGGDSEAPTVPGNLTASDITMTSIDLDWNASTDNVGVTGYQVYQNGSLIANTANTYYNVTGLNSGAAYSYYVIAEDATGNESGASNTVNATTLTDTEAPTVPTNLSSAGVAQTSFTLSWNASTDNVGVADYNVYQDGSFLTSTSGTSVSVTGLSQATTYAYYVTAEDAAGNVSGVSSTLNVTTTDEVIVIDYCDLYGTSARFEWIDVFGLNDLYNTSAGAGYSDFTNLTANVSLGTSYTASLSAGYKRRVYTEYWNVWIDFNIDGEFTSDEIVVQGSVADAGVYTATVDIPSTATIGQTRLRVSMSDAGYSAACGSFRYGEVEDYTVNITAKTASYGEMLSNGKLLGNNESVNIKVYPNPVKDELTVEIPFNDAHVRIINSTGAIVKELVLNGYERIINVSDLADGIYILSVEDEKGPITETFIKR